MYRGHLLDNVLMLRDVHEQLNECTGQKEEQHFVSRNFFAHFEAHKRLKINPNQGSNEF